MNTESRRIDNNTATAVTSASSANAATGPTSCHGQYDA